MADKCICCNENEIKYIKRMLCSRCYTALYHSGRLAEFPPIANITRISSIEKYGEELIVDLKRLVDDHHLTLSQVGEKYGVTRERIRQIFELLYGFKYSVAVSAKGERKRRASYVDRIAKRNPGDKVKNYTKGSLQYMGAESEKKVYDICASLNYKITPFEESRAIDLVVNGFKVEVKSAHTTCLTSPSGRTPLYHFKRLKSQETADFIICHAVPVNKFFVIPNKDFPKAGDLYLPSIKRKEWMAGNRLQVKVVSVSKYYQYEEAWHLLMPKREDIVFNESQVAAVQ